MIDLEKLKAVYNFGKGLQMSDIQTLLQATKKTSLESNEYLIKEGSQRREVFYLQKGLVRLFKLTDKGDEITVGIKYENQIFANHEAILLNRPSRFYFQAIEQTEIISLDYDRLQIIVNKNPKLWENRKFVLMNLLIEAQERIESFILYSPEERYIRYVEMNPDIVNRVPNMYIANVLGMTPVSLSRIRKRIATKRQKKKGV